MIRFPHNHNCCNIENRNTFYRDFMWWLNELVVGASDNVAPRPKVLLLEERLKLETHIEWYITLYGCFFMGFRRN